jgi:hypothetical protein
MFQRAKQKSIRDPRGRNERADSEDQADAAIIEMQPPIERANAQRGQKGHDHKPAQSVQPDNQTNSPTDFTDSLLESFRHILVSGEVKRLKTGFDP